MHPRRTHSLPNCNRRLLARKVAMGRQAARLPSNSRPLLRQNQRRIPRLFSSSRRLSRPPRKALFGQDLSQRPQPWATKPHRKVKHQRTRRPLSKTSKHQQRQRTKRKTKRTRKRIGTSRLPASSLRAALSTRMVSISTLSSKCRTIFLLTWDSRPPAITMTTSRSSPSKSSNS